MNSIERMSALIEQEARQQAEATLHAARHEAQRIHQAGRAEAKERRAEILEEYRLRAAEARERVQSEQRSEAKHLWLAARQELIEETIETARALFDQRGEEAELSLLERVFWRHEKNAQGERPRVLVPLERLPAAQKLLGREAEVEAGDMERGFILSFSHFDVNYQSRELFHARRDAMEAMAAQYLFGGEGHENPGS